MVVVSRWVHVGDEAPGEAPLQGPGSATPSPRADLGRGDAAAPRTPLGERVTHVARCHSRRSLCLRAAPAVPGTRPATRRAVMKRALMLIGLLVVGLVVA